MYAQAQAVLAELKKDPKKFAEFAKKYSGHKESAQKGGLFTYGKGSQDGAIETAVIRLKAQEEISDLIKTGLGFEILQRVKRTPAQFKPFAKVKSEIEKALFAKRFKLLFKNNVRKAINSDAVTAFVATKNGKKSIIADHVKSESKQDQTLYRVQKGNFGFWIDGDKGYIVKTTEIKRSHVPDMNSIKSKLVADMRHDFAIQALGEDLNKAGAALANGSPESVKASFDAKLITTEFAKRGDLAQMGVLKRENVPISKLMHLDKVGMVDEAMGTDKGYIMRLDAIGPFDQKEFLEHKSEIEANLAREHQSVYESGFIASLARIATIKKNNKLIARR